MPKQSTGQKKTTARVMHEFKHGELKSGSEGKGGKVKSRKQAIAIALHESGSSNEQGKSANKKSLTSTKAKEAKGKTAMQEKEGKSAMNKISKPAAKKTTTKKAQAKKAAAKKPAARKPAAKKK